MASVLQNLHPLLYPLERISCRAEEEETVNDTKGRSLPVGRHATERECTGGSSSSRICHNGQPVSGAKSEHNKRDGLLKQPEMRAIWANNKN